MESGVRSRPTAAVAWRDALPEWWPVLLGLAVMFVPTFYYLFTGPWVGEEQGHGPIIFGLALWLIYRKWPEMLAATTPPRASWAGWPILVAGLLSHMLGRSQKILMLEVLAIILVMIASMLIKRCGRALRVL